MSGNRWSKPTWRQVAEITGLNYHTVLRAWKRKGVVRSETQNQILQAAIDIGLIEEPPDWVPVEVRPAPANYNGFVCAAPDCDNPLRGQARKWCSDTCTQRWQKRKERAAAKGEELRLAVKPVNQPLTPTQRNKVSRGRVYAELIEAPWFAQLLSGLVTQKEAADRLGCSPSDVFRALNAYREDLELARAREGWELSPEARRALDDFEFFRERYFLTDRGVPYEVPDFHRRWLDAISDTVTNGGQLLILSPPRHGKTDLLDHFSVWWIIRNPNIKIMRVGPNEDIARNSVGAVMDHLENNELLVADFCGPGGSFKPATRTGKSWTPAAFTVATRTVTGIKSPTMVAVGRGGKILSRDTDIIILDDIEDHNSTQQPGVREATRSWVVTTLGSRKQSHTAIVGIGSRQHPEDLYQFLLDNDSWDCIVEQAHDSNCVIDPATPDAHVDCMLWPEFNDYRWLMDRRVAAEGTAGIEVYEMVYLNIALPEGLRLFDPAAIANCRDNTRRVGDVPSGCRLVAGLDPAATGYQAALLWAFDPDDGRWFMVDLENTKGGGLPQAYEIIRAWWERYSCAHWVIEENGFQRAIRQDERIRRFADANNIRLEGHITDAKNKWDPNFGVTALSPLFDNRKVSLPYADAVSMTKSDLYARQLQQFGYDRSRNRKHTHADLVMASWFPAKVFRRLTKERQAAMSVLYDPSFAGYEQTDVARAFWSS